MTDQRVFSSVGPAGIVHYARCDYCTTGQHPGGEHPWAGADDFEHAAKTGQPPESLEGVCGCYCATEPVREIEEAPEVELESLTTDPCPTCGETGPCGYDAEGRPMIHTEGYEDDRFDPCNCSTHRPVRPTCFRRCRPSATYP